MSPSLSLPWPSQAGQSLWRKLEDRNQVHPRQDFKKKKANQCSPPASRARPATGLRPCPPPSPRSSAPARQSPSFFPTPPSSNLPLEPSSPRLASRSLGGPPRSRRLAEPEGGIQKTPSPHYAARPPHPPHPASPAPSQSLTQRLHMRTGHFSVPAPNSSISSFSIQDFPPPPNTQLLPGLWGEGGVGEYR